MSISTITIGAVNYTAYASVSEADEYLAVDPVRGATWTALTADEKGARLVAATRRLDLLDWAGSKTGDEGTQENAWPRTGLTYPDGTAVSTSEVPIEVENATILLAGTIAIDAKNANAGTSGTNTKRLKAGSAEIEYFRPTSGKALQDESAFGLIRIFLAAFAATSAGSGAYAGGSTKTSSFCDEDMGYGLDEGYS